MTIDRKENSEVTENLKKEIKQLQQQLREATQSASEIKKGNIDALIFSNKKEFKVYTETTSDKTYRILIEKMHEGAVTLNENGTILYCNSSFAKMVNLPLQKITGTELKNFIGENAKERIKNLFVQGGKNAVKKEIYIYAHDRKAMPVLVSANTFVLDGVVVVSIILTDLTNKNKNQEKLKTRTRQLEQKNKQLQNANKELSYQIKEKEKKTVELNIANTDVKELEELNTHKENILAILSHDLRSPLTGIIGVAEQLILNFDKMQHSTIKQALDILYKTSKEELDMLDYLVKWARIKYASEAFFPKKISLHECVGKVFDILREVAAVNAIRLYNEIKINTIVFADDKMLRSVLQNLISNAIKHSYRGGKVTITSIRKLNKTVIVVKDYGIGMSKEVLARLFTPQIKSLSKTMEVNKGAGIGLLIVKGFLEKNGGEIWVESAQNQGSSFYFSLPKEKPSSRRYVPAK